jgi:hypothetical protein
MLVPWINLDEFFIGDEWTASVDNAFRRDALCGEQLVNGGADHSLLQRMLQVPSHDWNRDCWIWSVYSERAVGYSVPEVVTGRWHRRLEYTLAVLGNSVVLRSRM